MVVRNIEDQVVNSGLAVVYISPQAIPDDNEAQVIHGRYRQWPDLSSA